MNYGNQEVELLIQKFLSGTINFDKDESWQRPFVYDSFYFQNQAEPDILAEVKATFDQEIAGKSLTVEEKLAVYYKQLKQFSYKYNLTCIQKMLIDDHPCFSETFTQILGTVKSKTIIGGWF